MGFTGELQGFGLPELLQILAQGKKTGVLTVSGDSSQGRLTLVRGRLCDARSGDTVGEDAFFALLGNSAGRFDFSTLSDEAVAGDESTLQRAVDTLLLEAGARGLTAAPREPGGPWLQGPEGR